MSMNDSTNDQSVNAGKKSVEDYEWDESRATVTAWKWSRDQIKGKRAYGKKRSSTVESQDLNFWDATKPTKKQEQQEHQYKKMPRSNVRLGMVEYQREEKVGSNFACELSYEHQFSEGQGVCDMSFQMDDHPDDDSKNIETSSLNEVPPPSPTSPNNNQQNVENMGPKSRKQCSNKALCDDENSHPNIREATVTTPISSSSSSTEQNKSYNGTLMKHHQSTQIATSSENITFSRSSQMKHASHKNAWRSKSYQTGSSNQSHHFHDKQPPLDIDNNLTRSEPHINTADLVNMNVSLSCYTPNRTLSASSRKRGVCDSPFVDVEDMSSTGGVSFRRHSSSSKGSRRARSRIFSPGKTNQDNNAYAGSTHHRSSSSSASQLPSSADELEKLDSSGNEKDVLDLPPCKPIRKSSIASGRDFMGSVFAPVENKSSPVSLQRKIGNNVDSNETCIFQNMSSYEDLKFLVKTLRRERKRIASFGMSNMLNIVPPNVWPSSRKTAFITWATSCLGLNYRSHDGTPSHLQISLVKGTQLQQRLEGALLQHKKKNMPAKRKGDFCTYHEPMERKEDKPAPFSSIRIMNRSLIRDSDQRSTGKSTLSRRSLVLSPLEFSVEDKLTTKLKSLNVDSQYGIDMQLNDTVSKDFWLQQKPSFTEQSPQVQIAKLHSKDSANTNNSKGNSRLSYDHSVLDNRDFMLQMHGISSPQLYNRSAITPRGFDPKTPMMKLSEYGSITPVVQISTSLPIESGVETPMLKSNNWGSRPVSGKDWGQSTRCSEHVRNILLSRLKESCSTNLPRCPSPQGSDVFPQESPCITMSNVAADSHALGIEYEGSVCSGIDMDSHDKGIQYAEMYHEDTEKKISHSMKKDEDNLILTGVEDLNISVLSDRRRQQSFAKYSRMSICASALHSRPILGLHDSANKMVPSALIETKSSSMESALGNPRILSRIFSFLREHEILCSASTVCQQWADIATYSHARLMLLSVECNIVDFGDNEGFDDGHPSFDDNSFQSQLGMKNSVTESMERSWLWITKKFPWANFLSEGAFKRVYKVWNSSVGAEEAVSVMDMELIHDTNVIGAELAFSAMLSSLVRRNVCPNFILTRGVFTCLYAPPSSHWGCVTNKRPQGDNFDPQVEYETPCKPEAETVGMYQYIRMELCRHGDLEDFIKYQPGSILDPEEARTFMFQMAVALHAAGDRFRLKHYDVKLLNFFLQSANDNTIKEEDHPFTVLRYGINSDVYNLRMKTSRAFIVKLADYGTCNMSSDDQSVILSNFTTIENSPPEYMILGDNAKQGHGHDCFGLGLSMLHMFTGHAPYEEILESVLCPRSLKKKLQKIWVDGNGNFEVIRSVILSNVFEDEEGNIEGEADDTLYHTLYRFLVLFGIPEDKNDWGEGCRVWKAVTSCLAPKVLKRSKRKMNQSRLGLVQDHVQYEEDCKRFSFLYGDDTRISLARQNLQKMEGGVDILMSLVSFNPQKRASALDVINSTFMKPLQETAQSIIQSNDKVYSYSVLSCKIK